MTQLSRKQKYQELRDRLDEETTAAQAQPVKLQRLSRVDSGSHANKPLYPHDTVRVSPTVKEMPTSPVMEDLLGEVKQYNIDNGNISFVKNQYSFINSLIYVLSLIWFITSSYVLFVFSLIVVAIFLTFHPSLNVTVIKLGLYVEPLDKVLTILSKFIFLFSL